MHAGFHEHVCCSCVVCLLFMGSVLAHEDVWDVCMLFGLFIDMCLFLRMRCDYSRVLIVWGWGGHWVAGLSIGCLVFIHKDAWCCSLACVVLILKNAWCFFIGIRLRGKTTTGSALDGAVFDIAQILAYLAHNMSRSQLYLEFGHFGWLPSFFWSILAKRRDHHGVSSGWSSVWHHSNTGLSSTQYEQIPIILGVWPFWLTPFFFWSIKFWQAYG